MRRIELPEEIMPDDSMREDARSIDEHYKKMYNDLLTLMDANATEVILIMSQWFVERVALVVGENINDYDKSILRGVIERHIAEVVFVER